MSAPGFPRDPAPHSIEAVTDGLRPHKRTAVYDAPGGQARAFVSCRSPEPLHDRSNPEKERKDEQGPDHRVDDAGPALGQHPERVVQVGGPRGRRIARRHRSRDE